MPKRKTDRRAFKQRRKGFFSKTELSEWLGVSRNSVAGIAKRFGLREIESLFPEADVWRKILGVEPRHEEDRVLLRRPLQDSTWFARQTGIPPSTIRAKIREGTLEYPHGVQLSEESEAGGPPRSRRWVACVIEALADGKTAPAFSPAVSVNAPSAPVQDGGGEAAQASGLNVFAQIVHGNADGAAQ
ncbi:hypothetical protein K3720_13725 [Leisingera caerulea]|uniref:hypothetical protein n=1 Tax=Leisingera caerulea TaxID=506591 RepID=UPI0021A72D29|nr:hypothetical protein [Leisingera caerulea]UWQ48973.1 hypothetical protein K3720_13725 [Leisingera caerulea]